MSFNKIKHSIWVWTNICIPGWRFANSAVTKNRPKTDGWPDSQSHDWSESCISVNYKYAISFKCSQKSTFHCFFPRCSSQICGQKTSDAEKRINRNSPSMNRDFCIIVTNLFEQLNKICPLFLFRYFSTLIRSV